MLLRAWLDITSGWLAAFPQKRSHLRAVAQALGALTAFGRRTISRAIWAQGRQDCDWSADYRLLSRSRWTPRDLFQPILAKARPFCSGSYVCVAVDDTRVHKTGRKIRSAFFQRDPMSPKFRFNLMFGLRFLQFSLLLPLHRTSDQAARALPIHFEEVPALKKPRKNAPQADWDLWRQHSKQQNLSTRALAGLRGLRDSLDQAGYVDQQLLVVGDNSFCNRTLFRASWDRTTLLARARRDVKLCRRTSTPGVRFFDAEKFTPEQIRQQPGIPWQTATIFHAGQWRQIRFKQLADVYWQSGGGRQPLRLFVVAPIPYRPYAGSRKTYRDPAYLLTHDQHGAAAELLQAYFDRWQIEVNHREEKDTLGVGQAQVRAAQAVPRQPALVVAAYSALLLAGLLAFGPERQDAYLHLPKWRTTAKRPSCLDLLTLLRKDMVQNKALLRPLGINLDWETLGLAAAA